MWIMQMKFTLTNLISSTLILSIGLSIVAAADNQSNCTPCSDLACSDCRIQCPGDCPEGYAEEIIEKYQKSGTLCTPLNSPTAVTVDSAVTASSLATIETTSLTTRQSTNTTGKKMCYKCRAEYCKSCNVTASGGNVCNQCLEGFSLDNNYNCTNHTDGRNGVDNGSDNGAVIGGVVGGVVGGAVVVALIVLGFIWLCRRRRQGKRNMELNMEQGGGNEMSNKSLQNDTATENEVSRNLPLLKPDEIEMGHDRVTRYTKDPTEHKKFTGLSQRSETAELEALPVAPSIPQVNYDPLETTNRDDPQSYSPIVTRKNQEHVEDSNDEMYVNSASLRETDSTYGNSFALQPDYDFPSGSMSNMPVPERATNEPGTEKHAAATVEDEPQEIYMNEYVDSPIAPLDCEDGGPEEIYMNGNLENDEIYQNMVQ